MKKLDAIIDFFTDFTFEVIQHFGPKSATPIYKNSVGWYIDAKTLSRNYTILRGKRESINFNATQIYINHDLIVQQYRGFLKEKITEFKQELRSLNGTIEKEKYLEVLDRFKNHLDKIGTGSKSICLNPDISSNINEETFIWPLGVDIRHENRQNGDDMNLYGYKGWLLGNMIQDQVYEARKLNDFISDEISRLSIPAAVPKVVPEIEDEQESMPASDIRPSRIRIQVDGNIIGTLFYDLHAKGYIKTSKTNLAKFLNFSFSDKTGKAYSESTAVTLLKDKREDKRANDNERIIVPDIK